MSAEPRTPSLAHDDKRSPVVTAFKRAELIDDFGPRGLLIVLSSLNTVFFDHDDGPFARNGFVVAASAPQDYADCNTVLLQYNRNTASRAHDAAAFLVQLGAVVGTWSEAVEDGTCLGIALQLPEVFCVR